MDKYEANQEEAMEYLRKCYGKETTELSFEEWLEDLKETGAISDYFEKEDKNPGFKNHEMW